MGGAGTLLNFVPRIWWIAEMNMKSGTTLNVAEMSNRLRA